MSLLFTKIALLFRKIKYKFFMKKVKYVFFIENVFIYQNYLYFFILFYLKSKLIEEMFFLFFMD